jgi:hypothetical protein
MGREMCILIVGRQAVGTRSTSQGQHARVEGPKSDRGNEWEVSGERRLG